ncbi:MAG: conjugal transfer protein TraX [Oscillospiraceae bacterium]|nr:conjugal transfer protein TraX [Oscillospiraceae bacterium]
MRVKNAVKKGLDSFRLKMIALAIMTIDHLAAYKIITLSKDINAVMRMAGRVAAPLFLFLLAEGLRHTKSKIKYTARLYICGAVLQAVNEIAAIILLRQGIGLHIGNIFQTFFFTALYVTCLDMIMQKKKNIVKSLVLMAVPLLLIFAHIYLPKFSVFLNIFMPSPFLVEYSFLFVLLGVIWYAANDKKIACAILAGLSVVSALVDHRFFAGSYGFTFAHLFYPTQWLMIFAAPFILLYNGGKGKIRLKYLFYAYYPAHQYLFFIISVFLLKR